MKTTTIHKLLFCTLFITALSCIKAGARVDGPSKQVYDTKAEIWAATAKGPDFCIAYDSASYSAASQDLFMVYWDCTSGLETTTVLIFASDADTQKWQLAYESETFSGRVKTEINNTDQQIIFRSDKQKTLLTLPFAKLHQ